MKFFLKTAPKMKVDAGGGRRRTGFTMMEMLIVMTIIGVVAAVVIPNIGAGLSGSQVQIAARGLTQLSRYARNMALANQTEVELMLGSNGTLRVQASARSLNFANRSQQADSGDLFGSAALSAARAQDAQGGSARQSSSASLENSIRMEKTFDRVNFVYQGKTDALGRALTEREGGTKTEEEGQAAVVKFASNGVCQPCKIKVESTRGDTLYVTLNATGKTKIELEE